MYYRLSKNFKHNQLVSLDKSPYDLVDDYESAWFTSCFTYNETHAEKIRITHSYAGINDNTTNKLWWDFDSDPSALEFSLKDARMLYMALETMGCDESHISVAFSGHKGFSVVVRTDKTFTQFQAFTICKDIASGLSTFDTKVYDNQRIFRLPLTKHEITGLYKIPLSRSQFFNNSIVEIKTLATTPLAQKIFLSGKKVFSFPIEQIPQVKAVVPLRLVTSEPIDWSKKPKWLTNCRYALQCGQFIEGERSYALLCLGSSYKNQGFELEHNYRLLKGVSEIQATRNNCDRFPDEEIFQNIISQIYSNVWRNGQYSCKDPNTWLNSYCKNLGSHSCKSESSTGPITLFELKDGFKDYINNLEKNTIYTGIPEFDKKVFLSSGVNLICLGAAGSGKSSWALNILRNTSKMNVPSVFASLDMHSNRMFEKVLYTVTGLDRKTLYKMFKDNKEGPILDKVKEQFGSVNFFNKSCPSVSDLREYILDCQNKSGEKIKLVMVDYFERIMSDFSDENQSSKRIAGELQDLVNDLNIALITLVQPNKQALQGGTDKPLYDYTAIKGSSYIYQSGRVICSIWRPFSSIKDKDKDNYMKLAILKNDFGELDEFVLGWNGKRGEIYTLDDGQKNVFHDMLKEKEEKESHKQDERW